MRLRFFAAMCVLGGLGGFAGSVIGGAFGQRGLFVGGFVGGIVIAPISARVAIWRGWIDRSQYWATAAGAALGFVAAALVAVNTLSSPIGPVLATSLTGVGPGPDGALTARTFSYGTTARNGGKPVTSATVFEIGSETKVFTGLLLASFVVDGRVKLGDPLQNYLPPGVRAPGTAHAPITLLDLATHRSALPRMPGNIGEGPLARARYTAEDLYEFLNQHTLRRAPGAAFEYSNLGFGVLGTVLAALGDRDFETLVVERIGTPLQMPDTRIALAAEQRSRLATGYTPAGAVAPEWNNTGAIAAGGGLLSTADDEARFLAAFIDPPHAAFGAALEEAQRLHPYAQQPEKVTALACLRPKGRPDPRLSGRSIGGLRPSNEELNDTIVVA